MQGESRVKKSLLNAKVNTICYFVALAVAFFTRKVFIDQLGIEFTGLTSSLQSLLGFLNLAELGVATAIGYVLYKPIFDNDKVQINEIISVFGYLYRWIGYVILGAGIVLSFFLPLIFSEAPFSYPVLFFGFYAFLASSLFGYFLNYKISLLAADQKNYVVTGYFQLITTVKSLVQMVLALHFKDFILYFSIEILAGIANSIILNIKVRRTYPWLDSELREGRKLLSKYPQIAKYIKQLFVHKIASFVQFQILPVLILSYVSIAVVGLYANYTMIADKVRLFISGVLDSTTAGVGNLISEGNKEKIMGTFRELYSLRFYVGSLFTICLYILISPFVQLWLGENYLLSSLIVALVCFHFLLLTLRGTTDQFLNGYGMFYDVWAPVAEVVIFIASSIVFGSLCGLAGVLMGPLVSTILIVHVWKPLFLYSRGFRVSFWRYLLLLGKNALAFVITFIAAYFIYDSLKAVMNFTGWLGWVISACLVTVVALVAGLLAFYLLTPLRDFVNRFVKIKLLEK